MTQWIEWLQFMGIMASFTVLVLGYDAILYHFMLKNRGDVNAHKEGK